MARVSTALLALASLALGAAGCGGSSQTPAPTPGSDATLVALVLGTGTLSPAFASETTRYDATMPHGTASVDVTPIAKDAGATVELRQDGGAPEVIASAATSRPLTVPAVGATSTVTVTVTAVDRTTTRTYTIVLSQAPPPDASDASLSSLAVSAGALSPAFASSTLRYALVVPSGAAVAVTPAAADPKASVELTQDAGKPVTVARGSAQPLSVPAPGARSTVTIVVTAADRATARTYTIDLSQAAASEATLASLGVSAGTLSPAFASGTDRYTLTVPFATDTVKLQPTATSADARSVTVAQDGSAAATVARGAWTGALSVPALGNTSTIVITVTAADGVSAGTYQVALARAGANDATLKALAESAGRLTGFAPGTLRYDLTVPYQTGTYSVTPTASDPLATITVNGAAVTSGAATTVALVVGANTVNVDVTSQDRTSSTRYVLTITEEASPPAPVAGLVTARTVPLAPSSLAAVAAGVMQPSGTTGASVPIDTLLRIGFDAAPTLGTKGTIKIFRSDGTLADVIDLADGPAYGALTTASLRLRTTPPYMNTMVNVLGGTSAETPSVRFVYYAPVAISGNTVTIFPHANRLAWDGTNYAVAKTLEYGASYYVTIDDGVLNGSIGGAAFTGIADPTVWRFTTRASRPTGTTLQVSWDGTGDFATVQGALEAVPPGSSTAYTVAIAQGVYQELLFAANRKNVTLQGTSGNAGVDTIVQYDNCEDFNRGVGASTAWTAFAGGSITLDANGNSGGRAVFLVEKGDRIALDSVTLKNTHPKGSTTLPTVPTRATGPGNTQAEVLYFNATGALAARRSNFVSSQDTLQVKGYTWFHDCFVAGDVDYVWGYPYVSLFERSELRSRSPGWLVQSRAYQDYPGFVFLQSRISQEGGFSGAYLARSGTTPANGYGYDNVAYVRSVFDAQLASGGWYQTPNTAATPAAGWRQYGNTTAAGQVVTSYGAGSLSLSDGQASMFFADRQTIFTGATDGTSTSKGLGAAGWSSYAPFFSP